MTRSNMIPERVSPHSYSNGHVLVLRFYYGVQKGVCEGCRWDAGDSTPRRVTLDTVAEDRVVLVLLTLECHRWEQPN